MIVTSIVIIFQNVIEIILKLFQMKKIQNQFLFIESETKHIFCALYALKLITISRLSTSLIFDSLLIYNTAWASRWSGFIFLRQNYQKYADRYLTYSCWFCFIHPNYLCAFFWGIPTKNPIECVKNCLSQSDIIPVITVKAFVHSNVWWMFHLITYELVALIPCF